MTEEKKFRLHEITTAESLETEKDVSDSQSLDKDLDHKKKEEKKLFIRLLFKTQERVSHSVSRVSALIQKMKSLEATYLVETLKKISVCMYHLIDKLKQISEETSRDLEKEKYSPLSLVKISSSESQQTEIQQQSFIIRNSKQINVSIFTDVIRVLNRILKTLQNVCFKIHHYLNQGKFESRIKSYAKRTTVIAAKLNTVELIVPFASHFPVNDLFSLHKDHPRWMHLSFHYVRKVVYCVSEDTINTFNTFVDYITYFMYFAFIVMKQSEQLKFLEKELFSESWTELLDIILSQPTSKEEIKTIYSLATNKFPKILWEITNLELFKAIVSPVLPKIGFTTSLFVPKIRRSKIFSSICQSSSFTFTSFVQKPFNITEYIDPKPYHTHAEMRINSNDQFFDYEYKKLSKTIIVHIHGGGFISMSSYVHQFYIRKWAKELDVPIFSIEYGKAPQFPFPNALADCLEVYFWLIQNASKLYNVKKINILLMGDSSGGNLACSMLNFLINYDLPLPDGVILFYPALRVDLFFTPSFLQGIDDMIISHSVLLKIKEAYVGNNKNLQNEYLSPILAQRKTLKKYPEIHLVTGSRDPLSDDCYRMVEQINEAKEGTAYLTVFEDFPHGFLHFDSDFFPNSYTQRALDRIQEIIGTMLLNICSKN